MVFFPRYCFKCGDPNKGGQSKSFPRVPVMAPVSHKAIRRPSNAFILWRSHYNKHSSDYSSYTHRHQNAVSCTAGAIWRAFGPAEKEPFEQEARVLRAQHKLDYPDYKYGRESVKPTITTPRKVSARKTRVGAAPRPHKRVRATRKLVNETAPAPLLPSPLRPPSFAATAVVDHPSPIVKAETISPEWGTVPFPSTPSTRIQPPLPAVEKESAFDPYADYAIGGGYEGYNIDMDLHCSYPLSSFAHWSGPATPLSNHDPVKEEHTFFSQEEQLNPYPCEDNEYSSLFSELAIERAMKVEDEI